MGNFMDSATGQLSFSIEGLDATDYCFVGYSTDWFTLAGFGYLETTELTAGDPDTKLINHRTDVESGYTQFIG